MAEYKGKMVLVNFWAVWCAPCKKEFPYENKIYHQYKDKGLVVVNICLESEKEIWIANTRKYNLQMVNLYVDNSDLLEVKNKFDLSSYPANILIDRKGNIVDKFVKRASKLTNADIVNFRKM